MGNANIIAEIDIINLNIYNSAIFVQIKLGTQTD